MTASSTLPPDPGDCSTCDKQHAFVCWPALRSPQSHIFTFAWKTLLHMEVLELGCSQPSLLQMRINNDLKATALQPEDIGSLMKLRAHKLETAADDLRIDLAPYQHVAWMNDLERVRVKLGPFCCCDVCAGCTSSCGSEFQHIHR